MSTGHVNLALTRVGSPSYLQAEPRKKPRSLLNCMVSSNHVRVLAVFISCFGVPVANAWDTPHKALDEFLQFELEGGRLVSWPFAKYLAVGPDYDEPGWDEVELIQDAKVLPLTCNKTRCKAPVEFTLTATAGMNLRQVTPHPNGGKTTVTYVIVQRNGHWLLESSNGRPRVFCADFKQRYGACQKFCV